MSISLKDISYIHPDREPLFRGVSLSLPSGGKASVVGDNGAGKSTLLRIVAGELAPSSGVAVYSATPYYIPQHFGQYDDMTIAGALGMEGKIAALKAILGGDLSEGNYTALGDDWDVEERALAALEGWGLAGRGLSEPMSSLSGGEKTRAFLAAIEIHSPVVILLDEPSNHLDHVSRQRLYDMIRASQATILVVSHDRTLLNLLDTTYELAPGGVKAYGGNYEFYKEQKETALNALHDSLEEKQKQHRKARETAREAAERKQRMDSRGQAKMKKEGVPRIMMNTIRDGAENSGSRLKDIHAQKIGALETDMQELRQELRDRGSIKVALSDSGLHAGKIMVEAEGVNFSYSDTELWPQPLDFIIRSGDRVAVRGGNGSGKTTLLKMIMGLIVPTAGKLHRADFNYLYIDQEYSLVDDRLTLIEQVERFNLRNLPEHILRTELHRFLFPKDTWDRKCSRLSGGEKMKLIFCCLLIADSSPDLFILDEPTNNLDIRSLDIVTSSLKDYGGTLLVVSHDNYFLDDIRVGREITLERK